MRRAPIRGVYLVQEGAPAPPLRPGRLFFGVGIAVQDPKSPFHPEVGVERTAEILVERLGMHAFDFATRQAELLADTGDSSSATHWRSVARVIEGLLLAKAEGPPH